MDNDAPCPVHGDYHHAFLSYRRKDGEDLACHVAAALRRRGVDVFWDQHCLGPGKYADRLTRFDQRAPVFLPLLTMEYIKTLDEPDFCRVELETALSSNKAIIPLVKTSTREPCLDAVRSLGLGDPLWQILESNFCCIDSASFGEDLDRLAAWIKASASGLSGEIEDGRRFLNTFPDFDRLAPEFVRDLSSHIHERVDTAIHSLLGELRPKVGRVAEASDPNFNKCDFGLYAGVGGMALALWTAAEYLTRVEADVRLAEACREDSCRALSEALDLAAQAEGSAGSAFYCGTPGVHALAAMIHGARDPAIALEHTQHVLRSLNRALEDPEAELLYGRAGYLYSLLVLRRHTAPARRPPQLDDAINVVFDVLVREGADLGAIVARHHPRNPLAQSPLAYRFPARHGAVYFGAAHGIAGVLYVLLHVPDRCLRAGTREVIAGAVDFLISIQDSDGNFPTSIEHPGTELVHWCHGAPGIIPTLCKAYETFGEPRYLDAARRAADCVWRRGLLRKGLGVCHGLAGSALSQLTFYRTTGNRRYLYRALRTCEATWSESCLRTISETPDVQRYCLGVPNYPYSLMEGKAGLLYAYVSIQRPETSSFPGYDGAT